MKSSFLSITIICFLGFNLLFGSNPPSNIDKINSIKDEISNELSELDDLDSFIGSDYDFDKLEAEHPEMLKTVGLKSKSGFESLMNADKPPLGIPGFLWGFCFGAIGMLVVYLVMDESPDRKKEVMNALYGCIIGYAIGILIYILAIAASVGNLEPTIIDSFNIA